MLSPHSHEENRGAGGVGIVFFHLLGWKWSAKFRSKGRWLTGIENWGSRGKSNNLCDWFCGYFISACEEQWGLTLSKSVMGPEGAGAMWLEELGQGSKEKEKEKSWLLLEALASSLSKAWWQEMGEVTLQIKADVLAIVGNHSSDKKSPHTSSTGVTLRDPTETGQGSTGTIRKRCQFPF